MEKYIKVFLIYVFHYLHVFILHRPNPNSLHSPPLHIKEEPGGGYSGVSRLGGSPEGDGNDGNDYQYISYHPRPAAVSIFSDRSEISDYNVNVRLS